MKIDVSIHFAVPQELGRLIMAKLSQIHFDLIGLKEGVKKMQREMEVLQEEVARNTSVDESAIALLNGLAAQIESMKTDPVALQKLADDMRGSSDRLAAAVAANTPAAPEA